MKIKLDDGAIMPTRAHDTDAGLDLYAREDKVVPAGGSVCFDTGAHVELPEFRCVGLYDDFDNGGVLKMPTAGFLKSKSGLMVHHGITSDGTVDYVITVVSESNCLTTGRRITTSSGATKSASLSSCRC